ncbi:hypothetical protein LUZ60_003509 [Juncus effusus]|nr:hypothetical protein LUZ60_003509 [Juncus effusus]
MDSDSWSRLSSGASRRLQSRYDLYLGFEEADGGDDDASRMGGVEYNCPFCGEDFDFVGFCCHVDDEHAVEAKNGICPICAGRVGMDLVGHLTIQHVNYFKMQRKRKHRNSNKSNSNSLLSLLRKDLREGNSTLQSLLNGSVNGSANGSAPDPFISSLIYNLPVSGLSKEETESELDLKSESSNEKKPSERAETASPSLSHLSEKDQKERAQKSEFVQGLVLSTLFDDSF